MNFKLSSAFHTFLNLLTAFALSLTCLLAPSPLNTRVSGVHAQQTEPENPRHTTLTVNFTTYDWWLIRYSNNQVVCNVPVEHEGAPTTAEIEYHCGSSVKDEWTRTVPCALSEDQIASCPGLYLYQAGWGEGQREVEVDLPLPTVWLTLEGCTPEPPRNACSEQPRLVFTGEEPLPNEEIIRINGDFAGTPFSCAGAQCSLALPPTGDQGIVMRFWVDSSFGDSSEEFTAMLRVVPWGDFMAPEGETQDQAMWYVDILSSQWRGADPASCSDVWQVFPDVGGPPAWLTTPQDTSGLTSTISYYLLGGMLIRGGVVNAGTCSDGGLDANGNASECGLELAMPAVQAWQNQFDLQILQAANETGVPAQLLKNIFSRESQFWPGIYQSFMEAGLGQMTEYGADAVLLWNTSFYDQFCPLVLQEEDCDRGFGNLTAEQQNLLRGAVVASVNATCTDCPVGIDLTQANFSIRVFAEALLANCNQVSQLIYNRTSQSAGSLSTYEDLWRFTLVNYNAGAGCLNLAIEDTLTVGQSLTWENVRSYLTDVCLPAADYVEDISQAPLTTSTTAPQTPQADISSNITSTTSNLPLKLLY
jgi:hypothetical protein